MYKLVVIGGKLRGSEYVLNEGENTIGRNPDCTFVFDLDGISDIHFNINVMKDSVFIEDNDSLNGTFVNGKLVKKKSITKNEQVVIPNIIFQLVYVKEKKIIIKKKVSKLKDSDDDSLLEEAPPIPDNIVGKILFYFKYKFMPVIYTFNKEYEWHSMIAFSLCAFAIFTISLTIFPVLEDNKKLLMSEIKKRGFHYADEIARLNRVALNRNEIDRIDTGFLRSEPGVDSYELFDLEGRIVSPESKRNDIINDPFSILAKEIIHKSRSGTIGKYLGEGKIGIAKVIRAYNVRTDSEEPVGIISIQFAPVSLVLEAQNNMKAYLEAFATSLMVGVIIFAVVYYLTVKHLEDLRVQIEKCIRGKSKDIELDMKMVELRQLRTTINNLISKNRELQGAETGGEMISEMEDDSKYVNMLQGFLEGCSGPAMVLDSEKLIKNINLECEDLTGIRLTAAEDMSLLDVSRDQGFAATVIDLCDKSANEEGACEKGEYELGGDPYNIFVNGLVGKDNFAKAYFITFVRED